VPAVKYRELVGKEQAEPSSVIGERVARARAIQLERFRGLSIRRNAGMDGKILRRFAPLSGPCSRMLEAAMKHFGFSARAWGKILRVARTIGDLAEEEAITEAALAEAIQYRSLERDSSYTRT
jgi:magnesium chelatase family protein